MWRQSGGLITFTVNKQRGGSLHWRLTPPNMQIYKNFKLIIILSFFVNLYPVQILIRAHQETGLHNSV